MSDDRPPAVSVVIPTYNRFQHLRLAIASVLDQTFQDFEIIVHDNASTQDPGVLVQEFGDPRIRMWRNSTNIGQTANIVTGCQRARGKYVAILGDDDLWQPTFLATLVEPLEADPSVVVSFCSHDWIDEDGRFDAARTESGNRRYRRGLTEGIHGPFVHIALVQRAICAISGAVFRHDVIDWDTIPKNLVNGSDVYINYLAARTGKRCYYTPERLMQRRDYLVASASVQAIVSVQGKQATARASLSYWELFLRDRAVADGRRYFAMKRADNALRLILCDLRQRRLGAMFRNLATYLRSGALSPHALSYHLIYGWYTGQ
jgi:glycosyltransferase involved in cell wall biosynthesis